MPHYQPTVPKQKNYTDCGLYLLENAETFIREPEFLMTNLYQKEVRLFKTRLVEDKRDIMKRVISSLAHNMPPEKVGSEYRIWREELYKKMTHFSTKKAETAKSEIPVVQTEKTQVIKKSQPDARGSSSSNGSGSSEISGKSSTSSQK